MVHIICSKSIYLARSRVCLWECCAPLPASEKAYISNTCLHLCLCTDRQDKVNSMFKCRLSRKVGGGHGIPTDRHSFALGILSIEVASNIACLSVRTLLEGISRTNANISSDFLFYQKILRIF